MERQSSPSVPKAAKSSLKPGTQAETFRAAWTRLLPAHRLTVLAKTPVLIAVGIYASGGRFTSIQVALTMLLTTGLWTVLYAINEATDLRGEQHQEVALPTRIGLGFLCIAVILGAGAVSVRLSGLLAAMAAGQMIYCVPPFRLKRYWWAVLLLSGILNPVLRLECGALWGTHPIPPLAYFVFVSLHVGASIRTRCLLRERDRKLGYQVAPARTEWAGMLCSFAGLAGAYVLCLQRVVPLIFALFTTLAAGFAIYAWSGKVSSVATLRKNWLWFSLLSLVLLAVLFMQRS